MYWSLKKPSSLTLKPNIINKARLFDDIRSHYDWMALENHNHVKNDLIYLNDLCSHHLKSLNFVNNKKVIKLVFFHQQERLTSHGSIGLSSGSPAYTTHSGGHTGRSGPTGGHSGHGGSHGSASMHHQSLQSDFQPPYFPPPFHHATQSPPQQQVITN